MERFEAFLGIAVLAIAAWWWFGTASADVPVISPIVNKVGKHAIPRAATPAAQARAGASSDTSASNSDLEWRKAMATESQKRMIERDLTYNKAVSDYEQQRESLGSQIAGLERSNRNGCNNTQIEALVARRTGLSLPQR